MKRKSKLYIIVAVISVGGSYQLQASTTGLSPDQESFVQSIGKKEYSPYVGSEFPTKVLFGDTHLQHCCFC